MITRSWFCCATAKTGNTRAKPSEIGGKTIYKTRIPIQKDDTFIAFSDGAIHAGIGMSLNFGWERKDIIDYMEMMYDESFTAKTLNGAAAR